jgi:hypothetical protein
MNSSSFIDSSVFVQNSTMTIVESWFIPLDIFLLVCCILILIVTIVFLLILILDKTCHTVPMMLITNTYLSGLMNGCIMLSLALFTLQNDLKQIQYQDSLCVFRGYIIYTSSFISISYCDLSNSFIVSIISISNFNHLLIVVILFCISFYICP